MFRAASIVLTIALLGITPDARSYELRLDLARSSGVHGLAMWALGTADPLP